MTKFIAAVLISIVAMSGCGGESTTSSGSNSASTQSNPSGSGQANKCAEVDRQVEAWIDEMEVWDAEADQAARNLERVRNEEPDDSDPWAAPPTMVFQNEIDRVRQAIQNQFLRIAYLTVDNPSCFSPGDVADARMYIDQSS